MITHFVYAGDYYSDFGLKSLIVEAMKKHEINRVMVTVIDMYRNNLITGEKMEKFWKGKEAVKESVNDDFDSFFEDLRLGKEPNEWANTYFLPKLTEEELELVESKAHDFMNTFKYKMAADVDNVEMQTSLSESKYVNGLSQRQTYMIDKEEHPTESINDDLDSLFEDLRLGKKPKTRVTTYYLPQLTEEEIDLVERRDENFMNTFFDRGYGERKTFTIRNSKNPCSLQ